MPAGKWHSPAQQTQHKSKDEQYFVFFYRAQGAAPPMLVVLAKVGIDDTDLGLPCILGYHPPRLRLSKGMVLHRSPAARVVTEHLMQEELCSDLVCFSYVRA